MEENNELTFEDWTSRLRPIISPPL
jgi:hypothetical protein